MTELAKEVLGPKQCTHHDWFDKNNEEIIKLLENKHKVFIEWQNDISSISEKGLLQTPTEQGSERATQDAVLCRHEQLKAVL